MTWPRDTSSDVRDSFDAWRVEQPKKVAAPLADWKKRSPLASRLSNCRAIAEWTTANPDSASDVYSLDSLKLAYAFVNKAKKGDKPASTGTTGDGDPSESIVEVEANADAGAAILADLRAYLAAASEADRLAVLCELESIVNGC